MTNFKTSKNKTGKKRQIYLFQSLLLEDLNCVLHCIPCYYQHDKGRMCTNSSSSAESLPMATVRLPSSPHVHLLHCVVNEAFPLVANGSLTLNSFCAKRKEFDILIIPH